MVTVRGGRQRDGGPAGEVPRSQLRGAGDPRCGRTQSPGWGVLRTDPTETGSGGRGALGLVPRPGKARREGAGGRPGLPRAVSAAGAAAPPWPRPLLAGGDGAGLRPGRQVPGQGGFFLLFSLISDQIFTFFNSSHIGRARWKRS